MRGSDHRPRGDTSVLVLIASALTVLALVAPVSAQTTVPAGSNPPGQGPLTTTTEPCAAASVSLTISEPVTSPVCLRAGAALSLQVSGAMHDGVWSTNAAITSPKVLRLVTATRHGLVTTVRVRAWQTGVGSVHLHFVSQMNDCRHTPCTPVPGFDIDQPVVVTSTSKKSSLQRGALVGLLAPATSDSSTSVPTPGTVFLLGRNGTVVARRSVGQDGLALFALQPGQYTVRVSVPIGPGANCQGAGQATVIAGKATRMNLGCPAP